MEALSSRDGLLDAITEAAQRRGAPFLGICVGMQLLAARGLEFEATPGLDWMAGEVRRSSPGDETIQDPAHGLEQLFGLDAGGRSLAAWARKPHMYFTHSFALYPDRHWRCGRLERSRRPVRRGGGPR